MNEMVNKFLLAGEKFTPEMQLRQLTIIPVNHLLKTNTGYKNFKKQNIQDIFTKTN